MTHGKDWSLSVVEVTSIFDLAKRIAVSRPTITHDKGRSLSVVEVTSTLQVASTTLSNRASTYPAATALLPYCAESLSCFAFSDFLPASLNSFFTRPRRPKQMKYKSAAASTNGTAKTTK